MAVGCWPAACMHGLANKAQRLAAHPPDVHLAMKDDFYGLADTEGGSGCACVLIHACRWAATLCL